jgi:prolipoprotein diacylglyceryl transferase
VITTTLAAFPSPAQGVWHLDLFGLEIPIRAYAMCIIAGIIAALLIGDRRWAARGGERGVIYDIALWAVPFGLIGGRLYHVMTDWRTYFGPGGAGPAAALRIWDGGLGIWGAVALGAVGAWIGCRRRGIPLPAFGDAIAPGIVLAQAIGRLGNYFNQELYGRETTVPWGMEIFYRRDPSGIIDVHSLNGVSTGEVAAVVHPTFLYELLWNLLVFVLLIVIDRRWRIGHGRLFASYVALYCVGRFCVELLRDDTATHLAGIRINSYTSVFVFLGAVVYIMLAPKGREDPSLLAGRGTDDDEHLVPELVEELVAVAGTTGVVAAATVAGSQDTDYDEDSVVEERAEPAADVVAADPVDLEADSEDREAEVGENDLGDEALTEAAVAGTGIDLESDVDAGEDVIDEDHDVIDDPEFAEFLGGDDGPDSVVVVPEETVTPQVAEGESAVAIDDVIDDVIDEAVAIEQVADTEDPSDSDEPAEVETAEPADAAMVVVYSGDAEAAAVLVVDGATDDAGVSDQEGELAGASTDAADDVEHPDSASVVDGSDVEDIEADDDEAETDVAEAETDVAEAETDVAEAETDVAEAETDVAEADTDVAETDVAEADTDEAVVEDEGDEAAVDRDLEPAGNVEIETAAPVAATAMNERRSGLGRIFRRRG